MAGLFLGAGTDVMKVYAGTSVRVNPIHWADGYREGIYSIRKQVSDVRDDANASFVFSQVRPGAMSLVPAAGLRVAIDRWMFQGEVGFPLQKWYVRSGHDRFGRWQTVRRDDWTGFGMRYSGTIGWEMDEDGSGFFATVSYEDFPRVKFAGQRAHVSGVGALLGIMFRW